jgi:hypothetical protein
MMEMRGIIASICAAALLAGCAGGASTVPSAPGENGALRPHQAGAAIARVDRGAASSVSKDDARRRRRKADLAIRIRIPRHRRRRHRRWDPRYISAATQGVTLQFTGPANRSLTIGVTPSTNPNCTGPSLGPYSCTIGIQLLSGRYVATISTYDAVSCSGTSCTIPGSAHLLSTAKNVPVTMTGGAVNNLDFTLSGVVASLTVSGLPSGTQGTAFASPQAFAVTAKDAGGYTIVGAYQNVVTLSDSDTSGATSITTSGSDSPPPGQLIGSSDTAVLNYNGDALSPATISATASGATQGTGTFSPAAPPAPTLVKSSVALLAAGASNVSIALTGTNFTTAGISVSVGGSGVTASNLSVTSATSLTAKFTVSGGAAFGARNVTVTTPGGTTSAVPVTVYTGHLWTVDAATDSAPGTCGSGSGFSGDLRYALCNAAAGDAIVFSGSLCSAASPCTIALAAALPPITGNLAIDGGTYGNVLVDGQSAYRAFWADSGLVTLANLKIQNALAQGGAGGAGGDGGGAGGGGLGAGAGLFVNTASVTVVNCDFVNDVARGGAGGSGGSTGSPSGGGGGGGGGMAFLGGAGSPQSGPNDGAGGGGGGLLAAGSDAAGNVGGNGGAGGGGGGSSFSAAGGSGGSGYAGNAGGSSGGNVTNGGNGGFGGGGGGGSVATGGAGGFGGGGGGIGSDAQTGGSGGPGAGGGGGYTSEPGPGGILNAAIYGGNGGTLGSSLQTAGGGGGAAAGPAIFVVSGTLTTVNSDASGASAVGGVAGSSSGGGAATAGTADATPVFNYAGTVNGQSVTAGNGGGVPNALGSGTPALRRRTGPRARL